MQHNVRNQNAQGGFRSAIGGRAACLIAFAMLLVAAPTLAQQFDIHGPQNSVAFGTAVAVLPNGDIVVTDPEYGAAGTNVGAVYLYSPDGALISKLTGSTPNDQVGYYGVTVLTNGNFVIPSPFWSDGTNSGVGAVTLVNGTTGLSGVVSSTNSLVGSNAYDAVGFDGVTALNADNYVVLSSYWNNGAVPCAGAVTGVNGTAGLTGVVTASNSLVGTTAYDYVGTGGVTQLANGNYVVDSYFWHNGAIANAGALTWVSRSAGLTGAISASNSLVGTSTGDFVGIGLIVPLTNGNVVVTNPEWSNGSSLHVGAATWMSATTGLTGTISVGNSLIGTTANDNVGDYGTVALTNGNYVVESPVWNNGASTRAGAATWANGSTGLTGTVSASNSLVGTTAEDRIGQSGIVALSNGNYVVASGYWDNGAVIDAGAATWGNGSTGVSGAVTIDNSLVGDGTNGGISVTALNNGNYVVASPFWNNGATTWVGAVTWANGSAGLSGVVAPANSLVGTTANDRVGSVHALSDGNYVVTSAYWNDGATASVGAVTWANGGTGLVGVVSPGNSLIGSTANDNIGYSGVMDLPNGGYVVVSPAWSDGTTAYAGAATWIAGNASTSGTVSAKNSLTGIESGHQLEMEGPYISGPYPVRLGNGDYLVVSLHFDNGMTINAGAVSVVRRSGGTVGPVNVYNSVIGTVADAGPQLVYAYDATRDTLVVGQPAANIVSLFKADLLFINGFE